MVPRVPNGLLTYNLCSRMDVSAFIGYFCETPNRSGKAPALKELMKDFELSDYGSKEKNLNRFMAHIGKLKVIEGTISWCLLASRYSLPACLASGGE